MAHVLNATVSALTGDRAVIVLEDGQKLTVPVSACEGTPTEGAQVRLLLAVPGSEAAGRQALARALLNEILAP